MQLGRAGKHLRGEAIGRLPRKAVLHGAVGERLDEHRREGGAAPGHGARARKEVPCDRLDERDGGEELLEGGPLVGGKRVRLLVGDDSLADGDGRVGDGGKVMGPRTEQVIVEVEQKPRGD